MESIPSFLDFEASSLSSKSYPIELAWSLDDGSIESYLISPRTIESWTDWDPEAEKIHGISKEVLLTEGQPPRLVCTKVRQQLSGKDVYCDAPSFDGMWLERLFSICGVAPGFQLKHVDDLLLTMLCPDRIGRAFAVAKIALLKTEARKLKARRHRAAWDVEYLIQLWQLAKFEAESSQR